MYVVTVIPLMKGMGIDSLTYFSSERYAEGTLLTIPIRKSTTLALVTKIEEVSTAKTALRAATFSLRKLPVQVDTRILGRAYIETAEELSTYYAVPIGTILYNLLPPQTRTGELAIPLSKNNVVHEFGNPEVLQASYEERLLAYRSLVRETFAHSGSILIVVPSSIQAHTLEKSLGQGIEDRTIVFTGAMTQSELKKSYGRLDDFSKTKLIIATPTHAIIERHDITLVIVDRARASAYTEMVRPYLDYRMVLRIHAKKTGRRLIYADLMIRTEEEYLRRSDIFGTYAETPKRLELSGKLVPVVMAHTKQTGVPFEIFSEEALTAIQDTRRRKGRVFIFSARRGLAPLVVCQDCDRMMRSKESGATYSLLRTLKNGMEERWFVCASTGEKIRAFETCPYCNSWRLRERGIGIQHAHDELRKKLPDVPTILFDQLTAKTYKRALYLQETFYKTHGAIMLGTHMAVPYLTKPIELSVVLNIDTLLATPTWRLEEECLSLLLTLREVTVNSLLVQTHSEETSILTHARLGTTEQFYTEEIELRKNFLYPPFVHFIHFTWQGEPDMVRETEALISTTFNAYGVSIYPSPTSQEKLPIMHALIRAKQPWLDPQLIEKLRAMPAHIRIAMNPDRIV